MSISSDQADKDNKIEKYRTEINKLYSDIDKKIVNFFHTPLARYDFVSHELDQIISYMKKWNIELSDISKNKESKSSTISAAMKKVQDFNRFGKKVTSFPETKMFNTSSYGDVDKVFWNSVAALNKDKAKWIITEHEKLLNSNNYSSIYTLDIDMMLRVIWFYAFQKPYSAESFKKAVDNFNKIQEKEHIDVVTANFYIMKQIGGEEVLENRVKQMLFNEHNGINTSKRLSKVASALMWMGAFRSEKIVLQYMLSNNMQMSPEIQERLRSISK